MSDAGLNPDFVEVDLSVASILRNRSFIFGGLIFGVLLGFAAIFLLPDTHRSWATVLVADSSADPIESFNSSVDPVAERELAGSFIVAERAAGFLDIAPDDTEAIRQLRRDVDVATVGDRPLTSNAPSVVLEFSFADPDAVRARDVASSVADAYLEIRSEQAAAATEIALDALLTRQNAIQVELAQVQAELNDLDIDTAEFRAAINTQSALVNQLTSVDSDIARIDGLSTNPGQIISPAQLSQETARSRAIPVLIAATVLGGALGLLLAVFRDRAVRRDRITEQSDLTAVALPTLGRLASDAGSSDEYVALARSVRGQLDAAQSNVVAITTLGNRGHAGLVAAWLAMSLGNEHRVLLLSADFADRRLAQQLGLPQGGGLVEILTKRQTVEQARQSYATIDVVFEGDAQGDAEVVLRMVGLNPMLDSVRHDYDYVVISAPNLLTTKHAYLASVAADMSVLVVEEGEARHRVEQAANMLRSAGSNRASILLSDAVQPAL